MADVTVEVNINVSAEPEPLSVDASGVPATATVGEPYSGALVASGGTPPYTFTISDGELPDGLTLDPSAGTITGTPTTAGDNDAIIDVEDSAASVVSARVSNKTATKKKK